MNAFINAPEIKEAAGLFSDLLAADTQPEPAPAAAGVPKPQPAPEATGQPLPFRGDQLENILYTMCKRGGFSCALVADRNGLTLGAYNSPVDMEILAVFTTILGDTISRAGHLLDQHEANSLSLDINYIDKAVVRQFTLANNPYFIMIICPQNVDERNEVELSLTQIITLLNKG